MASGDNRDSERELERIAIEEIMKETKRGKERAETMGPMGWVKCPLVPTDKRFFRNVVVRTTLANEKRNSRMKELHRTHSRKNHGKLPSKSSSPSPNISRHEDINKSKQTDQSDSRLKRSERTSCCSTDKPKQRESRKDEDSTLHKNHYKRRDDSNNKVRAEINDKKRRHNLKQDDHRKKIKLNEYAKKR